MTYQSIIVSDLHLGTKDSKCDEFLEFLDTHKTHQLILNGDIIDGWAINRGGKWRKEHTKVLGKLLRLSNDIQIIWIRGNHDEFLTEFIGNAFGGIEFREDYHLQYSEWIESDVWQRKSYYVFHGDVLDVFSSKFKLIAKIGSIGYDFALWLNRIYNKYREFRKLPYYSISNDIKQGVKAAVNFVGDFEKNAVLLSKQKNCDVAVCGHIHKVELSEKYMNSGDWCESCTALVEDYDGKWSIINFHLTM